MPRFVAAFIFFTVIFFSLATISYGAPVSAHHCALVEAETGDLVYEYDGNEPILTGYNIPSHSLDKFLEGKIQ